MHKEFDISPEVVPVVPYGKMEPLAKLDFGDPVVEMELRYLEYSITSEEGTLLEMLGPDLPAVASPRRTSSAPVHLLRGSPENEGGTVIQPRPGRVPRVVVADCGRREEGWRWRRQGRAELLLLPKSSRSSSPSRCWSHLHDKLLVDINFEEEPIETRKGNRPIFLGDIWPSTEEVLDARVLGAATARWQRGLDDGEVSQQVTFLGSMYFIGASRQDPTRLRAIWLLHNRYPAPPTDVDADRARHSLTRPYGDVVGRRRGGILIPCAVLHVSVRRCSRLEQLLGSILVVSSVFLVGNKAAPATVSDYMKTMSSKAASNISCS